MKRHMRVLCSSVLALSLFLLGPLSARGAVLVYEGFDAGGANASLVGLAGATSIGFEGGSSWNQGSSGTSNYVASGLTFGSGATQLATIGGAGHFSNIARISRPLDVGGTGTIWGSMLINRVSTSGTNNIIGLTVTSSATGSDVDANKQMWVSPDEYGTTLGGVRGQGFSEKINSGTAIANNQTYMVLLKVSNVADSGTGVAVYKTWILASDQFDNFRSSGGELTEAELDAASTGTASTNVMQKQTYTAASGTLPKFTAAEFLRIYSHESPEYYLDEIRFSADANGLIDVTPVAVPEPASCALLMIGALALASGRSFRARRRSKLR